MKDVTPHFFAILAVLAGSVVAHGVWSAVVAPSFGVTIVGGLPVMRIGGM
jgi:hypothetical protein